MIPSSAEGIRWGLVAVRAPDAWQVSSGSPDVVVAVIDAGIDYTVPELRGRMWVNPGEIPDNGRDDDGNGYVDDIHGWDFRDNDPDSLTGTPINWHGTFVAGLVAAAFDRHTGLGGVAPGIKIMDIRFLDSKGLFYTSDWGKLVRAIDYAVANGARIINLSLYMAVKPPPAVREAIRRAVDHGVLVVAAAGNSGGQVRYLASWPEVLAVGAVDREGRPAPFSNRGSGVFLAAPGVEVHSFGPKGIPLTGSGTSFAAPHVSGAAALLLSLRPDLSPEEIRELLARGAKDLGSPGWDGATGFGLVDAAASTGILAGS